MLHAGSLLPDPDFVMIMSDDPGYAVASGNLRGYNRHSNTGLIMADSHSQSTRALYIAPSHMHYRLARDNGGHWPAVYFSSSKSFSGATQIPALITGG